MKYTKPWCYSRVGRVFRYWELSLGSWIMAQRKAETKPTRQRDYHLSNIDNGDLSHPCWLSFQTLTQPTNTGQTSLAPTSIDLWISAKGTGIPGRDNGASPRAKLLEEIPINVYPDTYFKRRNAINMSQEHHTTPYYTIGVGIVVWQVKKRSERLASHLGDGSCPVCSICDPIHF